MSLNKIQLILLWNLLLDDKFIDVCTIIYSNEVERNRFRHLLVNSAIATDIMHKDLKILRNNRWDRAFTESIDNIDNEY